MITVVQAQCVVAVARLGSFRKAAAELFMAQPAVSANVYKVERTLRIDLFERTSSGATLTPHGVAMLAHFEALLASHESVMVKSAQIKSGEAAVLRIASHRMGQVTILPPALHVLRATLGAPIVVDITHADEVRTAELVKGGQVELGLGARIPAAPVHDAQIHEVVTMTASIVIYCSLDHPFAGRDEVTPAEVAAETVISTRSSAGDRLFHDQLGENPVISRVVVDDAQIALQMVSDGVGVAPLIDGLGAMAPGTLARVKLAGGLQLSSTLMKRAGEPLSSAAEVLWNLLAPGTPPA